MTSKERITKALLGKKTDWVPFSPFLTYWWEAQSDDLTAKGELEFLEEIGADPLFRGHYPMYGKNSENAILCKKHIENLKVETKIKGTKRITIYHTPKGDLTLASQYVPEGNTWFLVEHPLKEEKDYYILKYIMDSTRLEADFGTFNKEAEKLGERGLILPMICPDLKSSFQLLLETWAGTENLVYALMDFPEIVEETLKSMQQVSIEAANIAAEAESLFYLSWEDTSTTNISPQYYRNYILPEINEWCKILHKKGKRFIQHACGHLNNLLEDIAGSDIDVLESVSPAPTGNVEMKKIGKILPQRISIVGGIEPTQLLQNSKDEILATAQNLIKYMDSRGYILANSDSCPPGVTIEKLKGLAEVVRKR